MKVSLASLSSIWMTLCIVVAAPSAYSQTEGRWAEGVFGLPGTNAPINALTLFDDGRGEALYAGGRFTIAGAAAALRVARWDGHEWTALGDGLRAEGGLIQVNALQVFDDGHGPALYAAGNFDTAEGTIVNNIAKWNGTEWSALGSGLNDRALAMGVYDDGSGPALYVGGYFNEAGGVPASHIARWDGNSWSAVGSGLNGYASSFTVFNDGTGSNLIVGGRFSTAGGEPASRIASWNGTGWAPLGSGISGGTLIGGSDVRALTVFDDGDGVALYVGGEFTIAGGEESRHIAKWNGTEWLPIPSRFSRAVHALHVFDDGTGPALFAGGQFVSLSGLRYIGKFIGTDWVALSDDKSGQVHALASFDEGDGPSLFAAGDITFCNESSTSRIVRWEGGTSWSVPGVGICFDSTAWVHALAMFDDGSGKALYAAGQAHFIGESSHHRLSKWNGETWLPVGNIEFGIPRSLTVFDDGSGEALYVGGTMFINGSSDHTPVARWDGENWSELSGGNISQPLVLAALDDGSGPALYAGGAFRIPGDYHQYIVSKWNGSTWVGVGPKLHMDGNARAIEVFDDGTGPALYVGGNFQSSSGDVLEKIIKWNGTTWEPLGQGITNGLRVRVESMTVFDDGSGPALYVGGRFFEAGGQPVNNIAKWDGHSWSAVGAGFSGSIGEVSDLGVFDDGSGPALYAAGMFLHSGDTPVNSIARWNGVEWRPLAQGTNEWVEAMAFFDDGESRSIFAGGRFTRASGAPSANIAQWFFEPGECIPDLNRDGVLDCDDFFLFLSLFASGDPIADMNGDGFIDADDFFTYIALFAAGC